MSEWLVQSPEVTARRTNDGSATVATGGRISERFACGREA